MTGTHTYRYLDNKCLLRCLFFPYMERPCTFRVQSHNPTIWTHYPCIHCNLWVILFSLLIRAVLLKGNRWLRFLLQFVNTSFLCSLHSLPLSYPTATHSLEPWTPYTLHYILLLLGYTLWWLLHTRLFCRLAPCLLMYIEMQNMTESFLTDVRRLILVSRNHQNTI